MADDAWFSLPDFKLGLFSANCSGGLAVTTVPERWSGSWEDNLALARIADAAGIDFMLPIARYIGYGGITNFHGSVLDPVAWQTGLLARTERLTVFATVHTAFTHPLVAAKQIATADQVGGGRAGINIVAGWNKPEYEALGAQMPMDHDSRYRESQEWWDIIKRVWASDDVFDWDGDFWKLAHVEGAPSPVNGGVPVLNAGSSGQGRDFAARNANFAFTVVGGPEDGAEIVQSITRDALTRYAREMGVFTLSHVVCRATRKEAEEYLHYYVDENADWEAVDNLMRLQGMFAQSFTPEMLSVFRHRFAAGHGSCPLIGSPDDVADEIERFATAGFAGMTLAFVNYAAELPFFAQEVLPRLERKGIRLPRS